MTRSQEQLSADLIERLLHRLDDDLWQHGEKAAIYVVGGANIALAVDARRTTTDIDFVAKSGMEAVLAAAERIAATEPDLRLGSDWINSVFTANGRGGMTWSWFDKKDDDTPTTILDGKALRVELASPQMMLALKTLASRPRDVEDAWTLMRLTGICTPLAIGRNLARFTGRRIFDEQGSPSMYLHIDPQFPHLFAELPPDLRELRDAQLALEPDNHRPRRARRTR